MISYVNSSVCVLETLNITETGYVENAYAPDFAIDRVAHQDDQNYNNPTVEKIYNDGQYVHFVISYRSTNNKGRLRTFTTCIEPNENFGHISLPTHNVFNFTQPGKINYFLYPCSSPFYAEFKNSDFGIHPAKNTIFQEYSHITDHLPIYAAGLIKLYRYWGYAPRILAEGAANIIEFHQFYCRDYKKQEGLYPLKRMLISREYDSLPNHYKARMQAASFASYLISLVGHERFRRLYIQTTDLGLENDLSRLTGKALAELEKDWFKYVDTLSYHPELFKYYARRELSQRDISEAIFLYETALDNRPDDTTYLKLLFNTYYLGGYYDKAADCIRIIIKLSPNNDQYLTLGNMALAAGQVDTAKFYYDLAEKVDSTEEILTYKLGQLAYYQNDYVKARELFQKLINSAESIPLKIDGQLYLGRIDKVENRAESADSHFLQSLNAAKVLLSRFSDNSLYNLRAGEAALCLNEIKAAGEYLSLAEFTELRPFYLGRTLLAMGKLYDIKKERERALQYYQRVIDIPSSFLDKSEAEKYLSKPFQL